MDAGQVHGRNESSLAKYNTSYIALAPMMNYDSVRSMASIKKRKTKVAGMELRHLRYFMALAERLHFSQAAEKVHVTQSTLSHQIKQLEDELGYQLFQRSGRVVSMTAQGTLLVEHFSKAMKNIDDGIRALKQASSQMTGEIRIGSGQSFCAWLIPACVGTFLQQQPGVKVVVEEVFATYLNDKLASGDLDLGIGYRPAGLPEIIFEPLYNEEMKLVVPDTHPFAKQKRIRMIELHGQKVVLLTSAFATRLMLDECMQAAGAEPIVVAETNSNATMLAMAKALNVATIAAEHPAVDVPGMSAVALENPTPMRTFGFIWKRDAQKSLPVQSFAAIVRQAALDAHAKRPFQ